MDVSIIIINYKTNKLVLDCVKSIIEKSNGFSYEIIVVDNSCDEVEYELLKSNFKSINNVKIVNPHKNLGTSAGNNYGAKYAEGKYLYFLNSDTILINNAIFELYKFAEDNQVKVVGSNLFSTKLSPTHSFIKNKFDLAEYERVNGLINTFKNIVLKKRKDFNYSNVPLEINGYICSASLLFSKELFEKIEGFDEDIYMYGDDPLLCYKAKYVEGERIFNVPSSKIIHLEGGSDSRLISSMKAYNVIYGVYVYFKKAFGDKIAIKYLRYCIRESLFKSLIYRFIQKTKSDNQKLLATKAKEILEELEK